MPTASHEKIVGRDKRIIISNEDYNYLAALSRGAGEIPKRFPPLSNMLAELLAEADVVARERVRPDVITLGSHIDYRDDVIDAKRSVTLAPAGQEHLGANRVSVMSPFGLQLLGAREGDRLEWRTPLGGWKGVTILRVRQFGKSTEWRL